MQILIWQVNTYELPLDSETPPSLTEMNYTSVTGYMFNPSGTVVQE